MYNLYSFGCSFSSVNFKNNEINHYGYLQHKLYNELLAEKLNLNLINYAYEGRGNNSIILDFTETEFEDNSLVIIQLTISNRIEFRKDKTPLDRDIQSNNRHNITQPITSATLAHFSNKVITKRQIETYLDFVNEWDNIIVFTDIYNIVNSIKKKQIKYPSCKFLLISADRIKKELFENNLHLYDYIKLNGFCLDNIQTWHMYGKLINDKKYLDNFHFSLNGNETLYKNILNIL